MNQTDVSDKERQVFDVIRQSLPFLEFVKNHPVTSEEDRRNAEVITGIIREIERYKASRHWCIRFSLYNEKLSHKPAEGLYRYDWRVALESSLFSAEAEIKHFPFSVKTLNYSFSLYYNFKTGYSSNQEGKDIKAFIEDATSYQKYMSSKLPDVETAIEVF